LANETRVTGIAATVGSPLKVTCVQWDGSVTVLLADPQASSPSLSTRLRKGIPPYTVITGDLDNNDTGRAELVVADSRQGLWMLNDDCTPAQGWTLQPNDWANAYAISEENDPDNRSLYPVNHSTPSLGDINGDGCLDILVGGTNGVYAINYKGVLVKGWPYYLDNRYWLQRGSVTASPVVAGGADGSPLVLFASPTGDKVTFDVVKITRVDESGTKVYYRREDGALDSIWDLSPSLVDSIVRYNDSLIAPYVLPGGYVDAITPQADRPDRGIADLPHVGRELLSDWPLTVGATIGTAPVVCDLNDNDTADLIAVSRAGWVYRWELDPSVVRSRATEWCMAGYGPGRPFAYMGGALSNTGGADTVGFYSFPNPATSVDEVVFRYAFGSPATDVRIDVWTYTGHLAYSWREPSGYARVNYPDWNEHVMPLDRFGPGVYRCRLGAKVNGKEIRRFWKMAVVK